MRSKLYTRLSFHGGRMHLNETNEQLHCPNKAHLALLYSLPVVH